MAKKHEDLLYRVKTEKLYPRYLELINELLNRCAAKGHYFIATSGYRSPEEQAVLYAKGRTTPGPKVTNAKPFSSDHQFGLALDFVYDKTFKSEKIDASYDDKYMKILADEALLLGLDAGYYWKAIHDSPHISLNRKKYNVKLKDLENQYKKGGLQQVFKYLDKFDW